MGRGSGSTRVSLYNPSVFFCAGLGVFKPHSISGSLGLGWHAPRRWRIVAPAPATVLAWSAARPRVQGRPTSRCPLRVPALRPHTQSPPLVWPASHGAAATRRPSSGPPPSRYRRQSRQAQRHCARGSRRHARFHRLLPPRPPLPPPNTGSRRRVVNVRHARGSACDASGVKAAYNCTPAVRQIRLKGCAGISLVDRMPLIGGFISLHDRSGMPSTMQRVGHHARFAVAASFPRVHRPA